MSQPKIGTGGFGSNEPGKDPFGDGSNQTPAELFNLGGKSGGG